MTGKELKCAEDLKEPSFTKRYNQIECDIETNQTHAMEPLTCPCPRGKPWCRCCNGKNSCIPSSSGTIAIRNCVPDENTSITEMLMSFKTSVRSMPPDFNKDLTNLVLIANKNKKSRTNQNHEIPRKRKNIN